MRILLTLVVCVQHLQAQSPPIIRLSPPDATLAEEFTHVKGVRELADGRVLIADDRENRIVVADFRSKAVTAVARKGAGPGEFRQIGPVLAIGGDSTILEDPAARRWLIFAGTKVVATIGADRLPAHFEMGVHGADGSGHVLGSTHVRSKGSVASSDSVVLVRLNRGTNRVDTIGRRFYASGGPLAGWVRVDAGAPARTTYPAPILFPDQAVLFPDGWIAIARVNPYRVDWCAPRTPCRIGPRIRATEPRMTDREKLAILGKSALATDIDLDAFTGWPETVPPFIAKPGYTSGSAVIAVPDGRLLIERYPTADDRRNRYDIIDRRGGVVGEIVLPRAERIIGFGARSIYVVSTDADDVQRVRRHPWM